MKNLVNDIIQALNAKEDFALATIITQDGSAPRGAGAHMLIRQDGTICGTIGGGILEARVQETAKTVIAQERAIIKEYNLNGHDLETIDMTCGGDVEVLIDYIDAGDPNYLMIYQEAAELLKAGQRAWLVTVVPNHPGEESVRKQELIKTDGSVIGMLNYDPNLLYQFAARTHKYDIFTILEDRRLVMESIGNDATAYIIGAGHVAQKLSPLLKNVGFQTVVMDDRPEFANQERFLTADEICVLDHYDGAFDNYMIDESSYLIIVTRGHLHDEAVLAQALTTRAGYIGMIGSKKKRDTIYDHLLQDGFTNMDIERVYSPIGLAIKAESPEEIAVSITAELIKVRAELNM